MKRRKPPPKWRRHAKHLVELQFLDRKWRHYSPGWASEVERMRMQRSQLQQSKEVGISQFLYRSCRDFSQELDGYQLFESRQEAGKKYGGRNEIPCGLLKWIPEDYICCEHWNTNKSSSSSSVESDDSVEKQVQRITSPQWQVTCQSQCASTSDIVKFLALRIPNLEPSQVLLSTPLDTLGIAQHQFLIQSCTAEQSTQILPLAGAKGGGSNRTVQILSTQPFSSCDLRSVSPSLKYTVMIRHCSRPSLHSLYNRLMTISQSKGVFLNYTSTRVFSASSARAFRLAKNLLHREYDKALLTHLHVLCMGDSRLLRSVQFLKNSVCEGHSVLDSLAPWRNASEEVLRIVKDTTRVMHASDKYDRRASLIFHEHTMALHRLLENVPIFKGDGAAIIRELIPRRILKQYMIVLSNVLFNAVLSLRIELYGAKVVLGDIVCLDPHFSLDTSSHLLEDVPVGQHASSIRWSSRDQEKEWSLMKVIESEAEAKNYQLTDVVLPKLGAGALSLFPTHKVGSSAYDLLLRNLGLQGFVEMKLAPRATYRRLAVRAEDFQFRLFDPQHDLELGDDSPSTWMDSSGIRFLDWPGRGEGGRPSFFRSIRAPRTQHAFLSVARAGVNVALSASLPRDASLSALLGECCNPVLMAQEAMISTIKHSRVESMQ